MSFSFALGDIIAAMNLSWLLDEDFTRCFMIFGNGSKDHSSDVTTVYGVLKHITVDLESVIKFHGHDRQSLVQSMVLKLKETLEGLQKLVLEFQCLAIASSKRYQRWDKSRMGGQSDQERLVKDSRLQQSPVTGLALDSVAGNLCRVPSSWMRTTPMDC